MGAMEGVGGRRVIAGSHSIPSDEDRAARFTHLVDSGLDHYYRMARLILRNETDAEDAVQDAVVSAWHHWQDLRDQDRFDAWFARIVANRCRDRLRRPASREIDLAREMGGSRDVGFARSEQQADLASAFESLNADQRIAIVLRYWSDLTVEQIAERVHAPAGTVKSRLHHALARLRASLERSEVNR
jgi:RNA polymerase sigma-70 factor (ECF subfamily)